jgi:hypothetical protein
MTVARANEAELVRIAALMERICALPTIGEQRALYDTLSVKDRATMDARGLKSMWRSRRSSEAHAKRSTHLLTTSSSA